MTHKRDGAVAKPLGKISRGGGRCGFKMKEGFSGRREWSPVSITSRGDKHLMSLGNSAVSSDIFLSSIREQCGNKSESSWLGS